MSPDWTVQAADGQARWTVEDMEQCTFSTHFTVPHVGPGRYKITVFVFHEGGYGWWLRREVEGGNR